MKRRTFLKGTGQAVAVGAVAPVVAKLPDVQTVSNPQLAPSGAGLPAGDTWACQYAIDWDRFEWVYGRKTTHGSWTVHSWSNSQLKGQELLDIQAGARRELTRMSA